MAEIERKGRLEEIPPVLTEASDIGEAVWAYFLEWDDYQAEDGMRPNLPADAVMTLEGQVAV